MPGLTLKRLLRTPLWAVQLATGAKSFADNPLIGSRRLNRMGLHRARVSLAWRMAQMRRRRLAHLVSMEDRGAFERQGYVEWRGVLPPERFAAMRAAILDRAWPAREMRQGDAVTRRIAVDSGMLDAVPDLAALLRSKRWRGLMRYVAGFDSEPIYYIQTILTHRADGAEGGQPDPQTNVHSDAFHPSMKAWLFLDDVTMEDGPLTYVPGSHRLTDARLAWEETTALRAPEGVDRLTARGSFRIPRDELTRLGLPQPAPFAVPANTLIVADTFGFHARGPSLRPSIRVELWAYHRRSPFQPWTGLDIGSVPAIAPRRVGILWRFRDRFERWIGQPWRDVGMKRPGDW